VRKGRAAEFADCGLGKTPMQLVWAQNIVERENKPVLVLAPLSVSQQTVEEAEKFGIDAQRCMDGRHVGAGRSSPITRSCTTSIRPTSPASCATKARSSRASTGSGRKRSPNSCGKAKYRLLCTATAAPNDYVELGTSAEALGELGYMDMLSLFFRNDQDSLHPAFIGSQWRLKPHAERDFWRWMASWARACRRPSDLGFDDGRFVLPELIEAEHLVESPNAAGDLFHAPARSLNEKREDLRRRSVAAARPPPSVSPTPRRPSPGATSTPKATCSPS
jgi:hypothetical protein